MAAPALSKSKLRFPIDSANRNLLYAILGWDGRIETVTSGALATNTRTSKVSVTGTKAYTLGAGEFEGQRKSIKCSVAASTPAGTLTLTSPDCSTISISATSHQVELEYHAKDGWHVVSYTGVTLNA